MKVLTIGGGGRECAAVEAFCRAGSEVYAVMKNGNPGIIRMAKDFMFSDEGDIGRIVEYAKTKNVDLAFVGPEAPLEKGIVDALENAGIPCASPNKAAARIETSKSFMRDLVHRYNVDGNLGYASFDSPDGIEDYLKTLNYEIVVKPVGLTGERE